MPALTERVEYRSARVEDAPAIIAFLRECNYDSDERFWRWINWECPHGETMIEVATAGDRVVGHYAVLPRHLNVNGAAVKAGQAIHAAVHPEFRGLAILIGLMRRIVQRCRQEHIPFLFAFPNDRIWLVYLRLLEWQPIGDVVALEYPLGDCRGDVDDSASIVLHDRPDFDERYQHIAERDGFRKKTSVMKDRAYLDWRYARHPNARYQLLEARVANGHLGGYLVLKYYEKAGVHYGHIVDLGLNRDSPTIFPRLVSRALKVFQARHVDIASCWMVDGTPYAGPLREIGFRQTGFATHMAYRLIDPDFGRPAFRLDDWCVVMGDSDAF